MDLGKFDTVAAAERGAAVQLRDPCARGPLCASDGSAVEILVKGADSPAYRRARQAAQDRIAKRPYRHQPLTLEESDAHAARILGAVTTGWRNVVVDGSAWEFSESAAIVLYERFGWIREQVEAVVTDRSRFPCNAAGA